MKASVGIAQILLLSGFSPVLKMGILDQQRQASRLADLMMKGCVRELLSQSGLQSRIKKIQLRLLAF